MRWIMAAITYKSYRDGPDAPKGAVYAHHLVDHILDDPRIAYLLAWTVFLFTLAWLAAPAR